MSIPFLPSLAPKAHAQDEAPRRFIAMWLAHGGVYNPHMWPADSAASSVASAFGDHRFHHGTLTAPVEGNEAIISPVLKAPASLLTPSLVRKMNILRGLDVPWYCTHGLHMLGNFGSAEDTSHGLSHQVSIDHIMAYSPGVYSQTPRLRSMQLIRQGLSVGWSSPSARSGELQATPAIYSPQSLFDQIYVPSSDPAAEPRTPVVDHVLESYRRLRSGAHGPGARLAAADRRRLDLYMERLSEVQQSMRAPVAAMCATATRPGSNYANEPQMADYVRLLYQAFNDVLVAAMVCDSSRIGVIQAPHTFNDVVDTGQGFHDVAHAAGGQGDGDGDAAAERHLQTTNRNFFQLVFLDLISKMDAATDIDGNTILDNSLVFWSNESGSHTHFNDSQPVIMAGGAGGYLNTGLYVDYRNRAATFASPSSVNQGRRPGLHYYQWLTTCLDAMRVDRSEWPHGADQPFSEPALGVPNWFQSNWGHPYRDAIRRYSTNALPVIT